MDRPSTAARTRLRPRRGRLLLAIALVAIASGCQATAPSSIAPTVLPSASPTPTTAPTRPSPSPLESGPPSPTCVAGWRALDPDDPLALEAVELILGQMGAEGPLVVDAIRAFDGPDVPWIMDPHFDNVRRWYVKASLGADPTFRGRWLVEWREPGRAGIAAVAPYDSSGYASPDWRGFVGDGEPRTVAGLPGRWSGIEYDFVTGDGDTGNAGLPAEVEGCLTGT